MYMMFQGNRHGLHIPCSTYMYMILDIHTCSLELCIHVHVHVYCGNDSKDTGVNDAIDTATSGRLSKHHIASH